MSSTSMLIAARFASLRRPNLLVRDFEAIDARDLPLVGHKALSLAELLRAGLPVPNGFVVTSESTKLFFDSNGLQSAVRGLFPLGQTADPLTLTKAASAIGALIAASRVPQEVAEEIRRGIKRLGEARFAVRSSGAHEDSHARSMAGLFDSFLNVSSQKIMRHITLCWASYFSPQALSYYAAVGLRPDPGAIAVIVQAFVSGTASGVCFTRHPVVRSQTAMVIEACYGLAPELVGGRVTPDRFLVSRKSGRVLAADVSRQSFMLIPTSRGVKRQTVPLARQLRPKVSAKTLRTIAKLCSRVERYFDRPQDIEWVLSHRTVSIVQSRPITAIGRKSGRTAKA